MEIEQLQKFCLSLPGVKEDVKWGNDLCFCIGEKMFCVSGMGHELIVSFKCDEEDFAALTERDGVIPAPYLARNKWVQVQKSHALDKREWHHYIQKSYELVASKLPKKLQRELCVNI